MATPEQREVRRVGNSETVNVKRCCGHCAYFRNSPAEIEAAFPGMTAMSSGSASVRAQDGLCDKHGVYLSYHDTCGDFLGAGR